MDQDEWRPIARVDASTPGFPAAGAIDDVDIVVWQTAAGYCATARACPHQYADLLAGKLVADRTALRCPVHAFTFQLSDGEGVNCPGFTAAGLRSDRTRRRTVRARGRARGRLKARR